MTDALLALHEYQKIFGLVFQGKRFDIGEKLGFLKASVEYGLARSDVGHQLRMFLKELL